jgi:hypothetical protein
MKRIFLMAVLGATFSDSPVFVCEGALRIGETSLAEGGFTTVEGRVTDVVTPTPKPALLTLVGAALIGLFCFERSRRSLLLILNLGFLAGVLVLIRAIATIASITKGWWMPRTAAREAGAARKVDGRFADPALTRVP